MVDAAAGGQVLEKSFDEIYALLNKFSKSNPDWQWEMGRYTVKKSVGVLELDVVSALSALIAILANQVNHMTLVINKGQTNQYGKTYNPKGRNHPNFSWGGNQGAQNQYRPQAPQQQCRPPQTEQPTNSTSHIEDMLKKLMADQHAQASAMRNLERQMGQLASAQNTRLVGALPRDTEANPKASINVVSRIKKAKESEKSAEEAVAKKPPPLVARPPPPFPLRLQKVKDNAAYKKFLDILKQVQINILLVDILQEVPKYAKYIKDIVANKNRLTEFETVACTEECSSKIQSKLPQILKDPGSFTIQILIGKHVVGRASCDLGASINLMSLSVFRQLGLGDLRPTTVILQLVDCSLAHPERVIGDG
ncbi:uncharacterized protein [Nicotiana tomentosiformis]|uniref:uncharacterized protein n=1 Tax=Nicotiana tomentosiformis TaxID=4098 RepID=UPI00388C95E0